MIEAFAKFCRGEQRLRFLYAHTYCDANATAPDLWNSRKEELHTQLFSNTISVLKGKKSTNGSKELESLLYGSRN